MRKNNQCPAHGKIIAQRFSRKHCQNSATQVWVTAGLEGNAEVTLKVGRCLTQYRHTRAHRKAHTSLPFLLGKSLLI